MWKSPRRLQTSAANFRCGTPRRLVFVRNVQQAAGLRLCKGTAMDPKELRDFATRCLSAARISPDHEISGKLRIMAKDYMDLADSIDPPASQQQQQIQPDKKSED